MAAFDRTRSPRRPAAAVELIRKCIPTVGSHTPTIYRSLSSRTTGGRRKKPGGCSRTVENFKYLSWRLSRISGRIYTARARERVCASRAKSRANPPAIHRDFRQLAGVIVIAGSSPARVRARGRRSKPHVT